PVRVRPQPRSGQQAWREPGAGDTPGGPPGGSAQPAGDQGKPGQRRSLRRGHRNWTLRRTRDDPGQHGTGHQVPAEEKV
ncbi:hypothetical protein AVEN_88944-1, partial [Araneus ventricosus]